MVTQPLRGAECNRGSESSARWQAAEGTKTVGEGLEGLAEAATGGQGIGGRSDPPRLSTPSSAFFSYL